MSIRPYTPRAQNGVVSNTTLTITIGKLEVFPNPPMHACIVHYTFVPTCTCHIPLSPKTPFFTRILPGILGMPGYAHHTHSTATQQQHRRTTQSPHITQHNNTTTTQKNNTVRSSATVTYEEQQTDEEQQAASKTTVPTKPKSRHYTHIMTISSNKHRRQTVTNYKQHKSIVPHDSTTGSHPSNHPRPLIAHNTATQQQHTRTTQSGHQQQSPVRSSRRTKHNKQQAKQRYQRSRKAGIKHT